MGIEVKGTSPILHGKKALKKRYFEVQETPTRGEKEKLNKNNNKELDKKLYKKGGKV